MVYASIIKAFKKIQKQSKTHREVLVGMVCIPYYPIVLVESWFWFYVAFLQSNIANWEIPAPNKGFNGKSIELAGEFPANWLAEGNDTVDVCQARWRTLPHKNISRLGLKVIWWPLCKIENSHDFTKSFLRDYQLAKWTSIFHGKHWETGIPSFHPMVPAKSSP